MRTGPGSIPFVTTTHDSGERGEGVEPLARDGRRERLQEVELARRRGSGRGSASRSRGSPRSRGRASGRAASRWAGRAPAVRDELEAERREGGRLQVAGAHQGLRSRPDRASALAHRGRRGRASVAAPVQEAQERGGRGRIAEDEHLAPGGREARSGRPPRTSRAALTVSRLGPACEATPPPTPRRQAPRSRRGRTSGVLLRSLDVRLRLDAPGAARRSMTSCAALALVCAARGRGERAVVVPRTDTSTSTSFLPAVTTTRASARGGSTRSRASRASSRRSRAARSGAGCAGR